MSSPSTSSSSSPEPPPVKKKAKQGKKSDASQAAGRGRNEGVDPTWPYKPPSGFVLRDTSSSGQAQDMGEFDWDAVADNSDLELWLIRVPDAIKPRTLENTIIALPDSSKSAHAGTIHRKYASFDIWSIGDDDNEHVSGEEIKSISCLLPKNGTLYPAPKPFARHLVVAAQPVAPTPDPSTAASPNSHINKNPPRQSYSKDLLKHQFMPIGALVNSAENSDAMDVDASMEVQAPEPEQGPPPEPTLRGKHKKAKEKATKSDMETDADTLFDSAPAPAPVSADLGLEPIVTKVKKVKKAKKEGKEPKEMKEGDDLSQPEPQAESTPLKVKSKKRKSLGDGETPVGVTPKKVKRTKRSTPLPAGA